MGNLVEYMGSRKEANSDFDKTGKSPFIPNKKMIYIFFAIVVLVIIFNFSKFSITKFLNVQSIDDGLTLKFGWPLVFSLFDLYRSENSTFNVGALLVDLMVYFLFAYIINVLINLFLQSDFVKTLSGDEGIKNRPWIIK